MNKRTQPKIMFVSNSKDMGMQMFQEYVGSNSLKVIEERNFFSTNIKHTTDAVYIISGSIRDFYHLRQADIVYIDESLSEEDIKVIEEGKNSEPININDLF